MLFQKKKEVNPDNFWKEYGEKIQETVLAKSLGRYLSGWNEYAETLWGLVIATSGGFRFHHFPHEGWLTLLTRAASGVEAPKEKTIFIPKDRILSVTLNIEKRWWKKILAPSLPMLAIRYRAVDGGESELLAETEMSARKVLAALEGIIRAVPDAAI